VGIFSDSPCRLAADSIHCSLVVYILTFQCKKHGESMLKFISAEIDSVATTVVFGNFSYLFVSRES